jgi:asparagine synthase (glutamine-hydrolysing)
MWEAVANERVFEDIDRYVIETDSDDRFDILAHSYERMYMMDQVLVKTDRASMMHALEVRAPFLDTRVVELANHLPTKFKLKGMTRKYILKKLMEGKLPKEIIYRKKKGFGMPIGEWMRNELRPLLEDTLSRESLDEIGLFNADYVQTLIMDHKEGKRDNRKQLWTLLVFVLWWKQWVRG